MPAEHQDDDSIEINVRPARDIVLRAIALVTLARRDWLEASEPGGGEIEAFERETERFELYSWATRELGQTLTCAERDIFKASTGSLTEDQLDQCAASALSANAMSWTLNIHDELDLAKSESFTLAEEVVKWCPAPWESVEHAISASKLRSEADIASQRERCELWYWRATIADDPDMSSTDQRVAISDTTAEAAAAGLIEQVQNDFAVDGIPFAKLEPETQRSIGMLAEAYLLALNWACGFGDSWDTAPLFPD